MQGSFYILEVLMTAKSLHSCTRTVFFPSPLLDKF